MFKLERHVKAMIPLSVLLVVGCLPVIAQLWFDKLFELLFGIFDMYLLFWIMFGSLIGVIPWILNLIIILILSIKRMVEK